MSDLRSTSEKQLIENATSEDTAKRSRATDKMGKQLEESYNLSSAASHAFTPTLLALTGDRSAVVRQNVFYALSYAYDFPVTFEPGQDGVTRAQIVSAILTGLSDKEGKVRAAAAGAIGMQRAPEGIPILLAGLDDPAMTNDAIWALGTIGVYSEEIVTRLLGVLETAEHQTSIAILDALAEIKPKTESEIAALLPLFDSPHDLVRIKLATTLYMIATADNAHIFKSAVPILLQRAKQEHFKVRSEALRALGALQVEDAFPLLEAGLRDVDLQWGALSGLADAPAMAARLVPQICEFIGIHNDNEGVACRALGNLGADGAQAVPFLKKVLASGKAEFDGRDVLAALAVIGTEDSLQIVREAADGGNRHAMEIMGKEPEAVSYAFDQQSWSAFSAVRRAAESVFPGLPAATWGSPEWHKLPRWEYGDPVGDMDLSPLAWIERRYPMDAAIPHGHILSFGLSNLYDMSAETVAAAAASPEMPSGLGIELSLRVALDENTDLDAWMPQWAVDQLQNLVGYQRESGNRFWYGHYNEDPAPDSHTPGLAFTFDPSFEQISSASGKIDILQIVLLTRDEVELCAAQRTASHFLEVFESLYPDAVNVIGRPSILDTPGTRERILELADAGNDPAAL